MFKLSIDAQLLIEHLRRVDIGATVTYAQLREVISTGVQAGRGKSALETARRKLRDDHNMVFDAVRSVGLRRLSDAETVEAGASYLGKVKRAARRGARVITAIKDFERLPDDVKIRHNAAMSALGAIEAVSSGRVVKAISDQRPPKPLAVKECVNKFLESL